jgi:hypothetical protein
MTTGRDHDYLAGLVREAAARLPDEAEEPEPLEEADALTDAEEPVDNFDTAPGEAEP